MSSISYADHIVSQLPYRSSIFLGFRRMCRCGHKKKLHASGASGAAAAGGPAGADDATLW